MKMLGTRIMDATDWEAWGRRLVRPAVAVLVVLATGWAFGGMVAARMMGSLIGLSIMWIALKAWKPRVTAGWSGAWLYLFGLGMAFGQAIASLGLSVAGNGPAEIGFALATVLVLPPMVVWKAVGQARAWYGQRGSAA